MTILEVFEDARAKIQKGWTQEVNARDKFGNKINEYSPLAVCWCLEGSFDMTRGITWPQISQVLNKFLPGKYKRLAFKWNDCEERTKEEVLELLDKCVEYLKNGETEYENICLNIVD